MDDINEYGTVEIKRPTSNSDFIVASIALICFALVIFFAKATNSTLPATDAATHADLAMSATSHGIIPKLPIGAEADGGHWGAGFNDHPFIYFYLSGWVMRIFGPDAWSAKLVPCLFSVGCVFLVFLLGRQLRSTMMGLIAGIILALSRHFVIDGLNAHLDNVMIFFILGSFLLWDKQRYLAAGAVAGMGVWFKTPVALLLYPAMFFVHLIRFEIPSKVKPYFKSLLLALTVASVVWLLTGLLGGWNLVTDYWIRQLWGTAVGGRGGVQAFDPFAFLSVLRSQYMPWSILLVGGVAWNLILFRWGKKEFLVPVVATAIVVCVISLIRFKYDHYFVPAYPFMALISAQPLAFWLERYESAFYKGFMAFTLMGATLILVTRIEPSPESFPALRKYMSVIQSHGDCKDKVLMVEGGWPYGTYLDYSNLLHFYTGRKTAQADCQSVNLLSQNREVKWILIAGKNYTDCLDDGVRGSFPKVFMDGNQAMLVRAGMLEGDGSKIDLTDFNRDLKAVTDCRPAPLPKDRYH